MDNNPAFRSAVTIVRDKTVTSHTSGSVVASKQGRNFRVSNNVGTDVVTEAILEWPDGGQATIMLTNESLQAPVGQKIIMAFKDGDPIAYQATRTGRIFKLGYLNNKSFNGFIDAVQAFVAFALPVIGTFFSFGMVVENWYFYKDGKMQVFNESKIVSGVGLAAVALATGFGGLAGYLIGTAAAAVPLFITSFRHGMAEEEGRKLMLADIEKEFDRLKEDLG